MPRTKLVRGLLTAGFAVLVVELGLAAFSCYRVMHWEPRGLVLGSFRIVTWDVVVRAYLPTALLLMATLAAGTILDRAFRGRLRWSWFGAVLSPVAALLVTHRPSLEVLRLDQASAPWAAPFWLASWSPESFAVLLQVLAWALLPMYLVAAWLLAGGEAEHECMP